MTVQELRKMIGRTNTDQDEFALSADTEKTDLIAGLMSTIMYQAGESFYGMRCEVSGLDINLKFDVAFLDPVNAERDPEDIADLIECTDSMTVEPHQGYMTLTFLIKDVFYPRGE